MLKKISAALVGMFAAASAFAIPPTTITELTAGISFAEVTSGILAVAALLVSVYVVWKGARMVISAVRGL